MAHPALSDLHATEDSGPSRLELERRRLGVLLFGTCIAALLIGNGLQQHQTDTARATFAHPLGPKPSLGTEKQTGNLALPPGASVAALSGRAADMARAINASRPFALSGAIPSLPFLAPGGTANYLRATDCLAAAGYYEAGLKPDDQRAVMQVVLNRVRHRAFPHSVCGVVFQGSHLRTGCQFTFSCDGAMLRRQPTLVAWRQAQAVATEMLSGRTVPSVGQATHYHTNWVHPVWSDQMDKIAAVDTHLFFRWPGSLGGPQAFGVSYSGTEPQIRQMEKLSLAHRAEQSASGMQLATTQFVLPPTQFSGKIENALTATSETLPDLGQAPEADVILTVLDGRADPDTFLVMAEARCAGKTACRFLGWTDPARKASQLPIAGTAIDAMSFSYIRKGPGDPGKARWNCSEFARSDRMQCLQRGS